MPCYYDGFNFIDNTYRLRIKDYSCRSGETGRRTGLKIPRGQPRVGSIPTSGTNDNKGLANWVNSFFDPKSWIVLDNSTKTEINTVVKIIWVINRNIERQALIQNHLFGILSVNIIDPSKI